MGDLVYKEPPCEDGETTYQPKGLKVLKFGGTSVGSVDKIRRVVNIINDTAKTHRVVVVLSAASGVTDQLIEWLDTTDGDSLPPHTLVDALAVRHREMASQLLTQAYFETYNTLITFRLAVMQKHLKHVEATGITPQIRDEIIATGERLSAPLLSLALRDIGLQAFDYDAALIIKTDDTHGDAQVDIDRTQAQIRRWYQRTSVSIMPIVTGFIGATPTGRTTTLGRSGSDYTAALLASALRADAMERWTDVDGLYTDDPRKNKNAKRLSRIVLKEAVAWNRAGRLGMHRKALDPLVAANVPVFIRSTAQSDEPGTVILPAGFDTFTETEST